MQGLVDFGQMKLQNRPVRTMPFHSIVVWITRTRIPFNVYQSDTKSRAPSNISNVTCHRCGIKGHIAPACTINVKRNENRSCFRCHSHGHLARDCPQNKSNQLPASQLNDHGENVSILERPSHDIVPPYTLSAKIVYPNGNYSSITALIDTGSPVSLLK